MKKCSKCKEDHEGSSSYCKKCSNEIHREQYELDPKYKERKRLQKQEFTNKNRKYVYEYLCNHSCIDCGEYDPIVLEFDHRDNKFKGVSDMIPNYSLQKIKEEIDKCDVRCANCHRRKTAKTFNYYQNIIEDKVKRS